MQKLLLLILICPGLYSQDLDKILWGETQLSGPINFDFIKSEFEKNSTNNISGIFSINPYPKGLGVNLLKSEEIFETRNTNELFRKFPEFMLNISVKDNKAFIENKGIIETKHEFWDLSFTNGNAWNDKQNIYISIPFALLQKNANCTHNGILIFALNKTINSSQAIFQISSETCAYFQFNYVAIFESNFEEQEVNFVEYEYDFNIREFDDIYKKYPDIEMNSFADSSEFDDDELTTYGFYDGQDHFIGPCKTRSGDYPFCLDILLPAYSLTKTISGTLGVAAYEKKYGSIKDLEVKDLLSFCTNKKWDDVTLENLADMTTGNYKSQVHSEDEDSLSSLNFIFNLHDSHEKEDFACNNYPRKSKPNLKFVYHSSDTYLLGLSLNKLLLANEENDFFNDLLLPIFSDINLSESIKHIRRTNDKNRQPYTGWGMFFEREDLIKLNNIIRSNVKDKFFSKDYIDEAMQLTNDNGFEAIRSSNIYYNNGVWAAKFDKKIFNCDKDLYVPFMSGFGGITVVFLPNSMLYYYVSDNYTFSWYSAVYAAHKMEPLC